ncbi:MAG: CBS domain-containing protein [Conexivisphaera sp.]
MRPLGHVLSLPLSSVKSSNLHWIRPDSLLEEAAVLMIYRRARHLPVGSGGAAEAILSIRDIGRVMLERGEAWRAVRVIDAATSPPISLGASSSVADAVRQMASRYVGSVLVEDGGLTTGIVTEKDLVRLASDVDVRSRVYEAMTLDPRVAEPDTAVRDALRTMISGSFRHLPITSGGRTVGITSMRDLVYMITEGRLSLGDPVRPAVTHDPVTIDPLATASEAARTMSSKDVGSLLVVDAGRLVGILTERDIVLHVLAKFVS